MGVYEQIKQALQDIIAPEIKTLQVEIRRLDERIESGVRRLDEKIESSFGRLDEKVGTTSQRLDGKIDSRKAEMISEIRRLDTRLDSLERDLKLGISIPLHPWPGNGRGRWENHLILL